MPRVPGSGALSERVPDSGRAVEDSSFDLTDVPAAVVCAICGMPDCVGCGVEEPTNASGVVAIVPWERPGLGFLSRLWSTAELATSQRSFFSALPDGPIAPALSFALIAETLSVFGLLLVLGGIALAALPELPELLLMDAGLRQTAGKIALWLGPGLIAFMVIAHAAYGVALDLAARDRSVRRRGRGLRFGLYACGWDLVTLPLGLVVVALKNGLGAALKVAPLGVTAPFQGAQAYLTGVHGFAPDAATVIAKRTARYTGVVLLVALAIVIVLAAVL